MVGIYTTYHVFDVLLRTKISILQIMLSSCVCMIQNVRHSRMLKIKDSFSHRNSCLIYHVLHACAVFIAVLDCNKLIRLCTYLYARGGKASFPRVENSAGRQPIVISCLFFVFFPVNLTSGSKAY